MTLYGLFQCILQNLQCGQLAFVSAEHSLDKHVLPGSKANSAVRCQQKHHPSGQQPLSMLLTCLVRILFWNLLLELPGFGTCCLNCQVRPQSPGLIV